MRSLRPCSAAAVSILCWITLCASTDTTQDGAAVFCGNEECTQLTRTARLIKGVNFENTFLPEGTTVDILGEQVLHPNLLLARHADRTFYVDSSLLHQDKFIVSTFIKTVMPKTSSQPKSPESSAEGKAAPSLAEHADSEGKASNQRVKTDVPPSTPPPAQTEVPESLQAPSKSPPNQPPKQSVEEASGTSQQAFPPKQVTPEAAADTKSGQQKQIDNSEAENTMQASASTPTSAKAVQEPPPASKELQEKVKPLEKDAVVTGKKHVESVPTEPVSGGSVVANGSVSNHPEPVNHVPFENASKVGQSQSAEKTDQLSPPSEAQSSVKKAPSTKQNEPPHEGTLAGSSVEKQGAETLTSKHAPGSTVSGTPEPSPESINLEISDQKPKGEATSAEPSEKPQSSDLEPRLSPPSPPPPTSQAPSADDSKPVEEPIATNFSEAPTGGGHEKDQVELGPKEPVSGGSVVANGSVSNHPEPVNHVPFENASKVGQSQSAEKTDQPSPPSEAQSSVKKTPSTKQKEPPHEGTLAGSSVEKQGAETLTSKHAPGSTVSGTPEPSPESINLEISDQKPKGEATSAEPSEKPQSSDLEPRLSPPSPPPPTSQAPSADDSKPVEEPIATNFSEAPTGGGHEQDQVELGPSPSSESTESKSSDRLPIANNDLASPHISEANESHSSSVSLQGNSSPHNPAPTGSSPGHEDLQHVKVPTTNEPLLDKPTNVESGHTQGATANKGSPSPQSRDSPDSPHLPEDLVEPSENSSRRLIYSGFIQCLLQSANHSLPTNLVTSKSALSSFTLFLSDNFITLAEKALTFISPNHVKMADNFLYTILGVPLSFLVAWWFFLFSAFVTYVLIRVGARVLIGSSGVGDVKQRSLVDWLAIEEHANQLAARLADQEEANARLTIWTMELSARCEEQVRSQSNTESSSQAQLREARSALNQSRLETKELQATHDALVQQISSMKCDRASLEERLKAANDRYEAAENDWRLNRAELDKTHNIQVQALQEEKAELLARLNTHREKVDEMETAMKKLTASSQKLEEELVTRDRELAGLRDMFIQLKSFELSLSQTNADAALPDVAASRNASKEDGARPMLATSSGSSDQDAADGSDWGAEVDELANEVDISNQLAVPDRTNSQESGEHETREGQSEQLQQVLANFLDVGKLRADLSAMGDQLKAEMDRCKQEAELRSQLQEKLAALEESNVTLQQKCSQAEDDRSAAQKKLEILSDYFKEREVVMQRDLGRQALSESETNDELNYLRQRAKSLDVEVKALREQVISARHELVENERASRRQITQLDKRLHENWLAARASENLVKELRDENTALRQKIGDGEKRTLQQLISRGPPIAMPLLQPPLVPPGGAKKPDSRPSSRQFANSTPQMPLKPTAGSRSTPPFLPPPPSLPGMPPFAAGAPGVPFMPPPPPPPPPGLIPPKGGLPLLPTVQRAFSNRNSPLPPGWEAMHVPSLPPVAPHSNSGSSRSAKR